MLTRRRCCCGATPCTCECEIPADAVLTLTWDNPAFPELTGSASLNPIAPCVWETPCEDSPYFNFCGTPGTASVQFYCGGADLFAQLVGLCGTSPGCASPPAVTIIPTLVSYTCSPLHYHFSGGLFSVFNFYVDGP